MHSWIEVNNVTIDIPIFGADRSFRSALANRYIGGQLKAQNNSITVTALDNINLSLRSGDRLGLIGHNGAGKSTLLYLLAGMHFPEKGTIRTHGKITPLFSSSPGLDAADTGLENIRTIGAYLGMSKEEINTKIQDIINFSELEDFIHLPVRTYSAGMISRLSFGVTTALDSNILLVDEGIGAGDEAFAQKAKKRLDDLYNRTEIIVLASHSRDLIRQLCNKAILLRHGKIIAKGTVDQIYDLYSAEMEAG